MPKMFVLKVIRSELTIWSSLIVISLFINQLCIIKPVLCQSHQSRREEERINCKKLFSLEGLSETKS